MSSSTRHETEILDAPADLLTMAVTRSDESPVPPPAWQTIEEVFAALESPLLLYARRLLGSIEVSEDIVQEAFMKLHAQFHSVLNPQPWLYRTVHNLAVDHQRRASKIVLVGPASTEDESCPIQEASDSQPLPDEQIARWEGIGLVRLVLETLDERSRELIRLRFNEDLSYKEIAERTGLTVGHVGYLLHHALKAMAVELEKTEVAR
ncbi:RNA polymerase, sigma-24 subunit, ECF subfamily [Chthoniobacter flavus Ellin428]|uniref:RNA polymerase, sigma-24 subunit, ECF subfamily n=1 Tax=Chthoniobacter flavus Ellin428 TaxID=497964 RepID=B4D1N8_9BACT|nr:sigma-70 family RNA polymerase sigma factor [Chthoniobacter flavus]EDY19650.1 RNA polymerase, sigma-24 subunit, ECF subfamily [Chthoniobacter flavus Ellin428]TCO92887.1 RNA polymerase sigma-70 factor (ECF subfamily) [Chthoniobacter flavus]